MELFYRKLGESGTPIVILHGLYGASDNWISIGKQLSLSHQVYLLDLRNHGNSPHNNSHKYSDLVADLSEFIQKNEIQKPILIGHSMGGKTAMLLALQYPSLISKLIVIDIAPKNYNPKSTKALEHKELIKTMLAIKLDEFSNRKDIAEKLNSLILPIRTQQLILKNIKREKNKFQWKINLTALQQNLNHLLRGFDNTDSLKFTKETLFIKAQNSNYIQKEDAEIIKTLFPFALIKEIPEAGHWVHIEQTKLLISEIKFFLKSV